MKLSITFSILLLVGITAAAPAKDSDDETIIITKEFYPDEFVKYTSKHDIVNIVVPLNSLNFDENEDSKSDEDLDVTFFFVEADINKDGKRTYKGLYVFKNGKATKLLNNGRAAAATSDDTKQVFFGAQDGLYQYNSESNEAVKYGSVTDSIIGIAKTNTSDIIYILTEDHELYKVTDAGNTKTKVSEVVNAQEIVLDYSDNVYFYAKDKKPYVLTASGIQSVEGLPANPKKVNLLKPSFIMEGSVLFVVDNEVYFIYANGTCEKTEFEFKPNTKPTAYAMEATLIQYYAYNKKIYEYNLMAPALCKRVEGFKNFLEDKTSAIQSLATQKKGTKIRI